MLIKRESPIAVNSSVNSSKVLSFAVKPKQSGTGVSDCFGLFVRVLFVSSLELISGT